VRKDLHEHSVASLAIVPINYEDRPMGVLVLRARQHVDFGEHELSVARTVANATAIALRNARVIKRLRDKTERVTFARFKAERRLRLLKRYETFLESAADGIVVIDNDGQILFSNARARAICGYTDTELLGRSFDSLAIKEDQQQLGSIRAGFSRGEYPRSADIRLLRRDGISIVLSINFSSVLRQDNAALLSLRDVTRERMVDAELKKTKEFLERVIDSSANAILSVDRQGIVRLFNRASERCFGLRAEQVIGLRVVRDLFPPEGVEDVLSIISPHSADPHRPRRIEDHRTHVLSAGQELVPVSLSSAQIFEGGRSEGAVVVFTDLRDKLRMEARLAAAQEELQSREKQAIIAELAGAAAHELNQPLTSVMGYAELLKRKLEPDTPSYAAADIIMSEAERMAEIVRKIGKITRYETKTYVGAAKILDLDRASEEPHNRR
jgi:PAS domain S-box-containing protein